MFEAIKNSVNLLQVLEKELQVPFKESGTDTYAIEDEREYGGCPACSHSDCFKIKHADDNLAGSFYKCFSCDIHGSVIDFIAWKYELSLRDAALKLAKEYNIVLPKDYNPIQEIFDIAAKYYANCFWDTSATPQLKLGKMTPVEYQTKVRKHKEETLKTIRIGWSDGGLIDFLESVGFDPELLLETGLKSKKTGKDFLPNDCFIYPHYSGGKVSHFTFKDPLKKLTYQLPNKYVLNGVEFYNQDSVKLHDRVIVVEGENDLISVVENTDKYAVIATIGQISGDQLDWMRSNLGNKHVITMFDPDDAGDKYRIKVGKIKASFLSLAQVKPPGDKDVDDHLTSNADLDGLIASNTVTVEIPGMYVPPKDAPKLGIAVGEDGEAVAEDSKDNKFFFEKHGAYYKVKYKDGEPIYTKVSNFTLKLLNVYLTEEGDRLREIIVIKEDGFVSDPIEINSETKVSLKPFRTLMARAADADFTGTDFDLISMWDLIYSQASEVLVKVTRIVGRHERNRAWIFRNKLITDSGTVVDPDESGIFWMNGKSIGIRPESLNKNIGSDNSNTDIPLLEVEGTSEQREELLKGFAENLAKNLGNPGPALLLLGWMNSCAYSNSLFPLNHGFPMLFVWGSNGQGKGTICSWLMSTYDMDINGKTTIAQLKSGVGFGRKAEYYSSLPLFIDEIRADVETKSYENIFRSYYDRDGRTMGAREGFGVKYQAVRGCFMYAGEDHFEDPATKERCVTVRIPKLGRETVESYQWIDSHKADLPSLGYKWILESVNEDHTKLLTEIKKLDRELIIEAKCSSRKSKNWAVIGVFALRMAERFFPGFDMRKYLYEISTSDSDAQKNETTVAQFFETIESIMSQEGVPKITNAHISKEENLLHIWFPHVYRTVNEAYHGRFAFTKNAVLASLREEPYFVSDNKKIFMGSNGVRRVCVTLDLDKATNTIKNIGQSNVG